MHILDLDVHLGSNSGEQAAFTGGGRSSVKTRQNLLLTHPLRQLTYGHRRISTCSNVLRLLESWRILSHPAGRFCKESYCTCDLIDLRPKCHQIQPSSELFQILPIDKKTYHFEYPQILWSYRAELPGSLSRNIRVKHTPKVDSHYAAPVLSCLCSRRTSIVFLFWSARQILWKSILFRCYEEFFTLCARYHMIYSLLGPWTLLRALIKLITIHRSRLQAPSSFQP